MDDHVDVIARMAREEVPKRSSHKFAPVFQDVAAHCTAPVRVVALGSLIPGGFQERGCLVATDREIVLVSSSRKGTRRVVVGWDELVSLAARLPDRIARADWVPDRLKDHRIVDIVVNGGVRHVFVPKSFQQLDVRLEGVAGRSLANLEEAERIAAWWEDPTFTSWSGFSNCTYLGGLPEYPRRARGGLMLGSEGVVMRTGIGAAIAIPWSEVEGMAVDGPEVAQRRVTATRLAAVGLFAFAWKKKEAVAYVSVRTREGTGVFELSGADVVPTRAKLGPILNRAGTLPDPDDGGEQGGQWDTQPSLVDQLERLGRMNRDGELSDEEYTSAKAALLRGSAPPE